MGWPVVPLGDVAKRIQRAETPQPGTSYGQIGVRLWGQGAYQRETIDGAETKYPVFYRVQRYDIIVNKIWARNGSVAVVTSNLDGLFGSSEFPTYEADRKSLLPGWFAWFTKTPDLWEQCDNLSRGTSGKNRLRPERFLDVRLPLPPLVEQRRIVAKLDKVAGLVEKRRRLLEKAERDAHAMLSNAFREIIDGAPYRPMAEVAPLVRRPVVVEPDRQYIEIGVKSFYKGIFHRRTMNGSEYSWQKLFWIKEGDLVFSNLMAWEQGIAAASAEDKGCVGNHRMLTCEVNRSLATSPFLLAYFKTEEGFMQVAGHSPGSIARNKTLSSKKLPTIKVPVPPLDRQRWFDRLQTQVHQMEAIRKNAGQDMDALLPAMLQGVFHDENTPTPVQVA